MVLKSLTTPSWETLESQDANQMSTELNHQLASKLPSGQSCNLSAGKDSQKIIITTETKQSIKTGSGLLFYFLRILEC